jgi:S1-C subfamily serine protease
MHFKKIRFYFIFLLIFLFLLFLSCKSEEKVVKTYSIFPEQKELEDLFNSNDYNKIISYYIYFQNTQDILFKEKLNSKMHDFLVLNIKKDLIESNTITAIARDINNYLFFKIFIIENNYDQKKINYNINDPLINDAIDYLIDKISKVDNYYLFTAYLSYLTTIFPFYIEKFEQLYKKQFDDSKFISSYEDVYKNSVMVILDKGIKIENGQSMPDISIGTGFFIDKDKIITNYHVVNGEGKKYLLSIKLNSLTFPASVVLFDESLDLAILQVPFENKDFKYFKISKDVKIGDEVIASGNPFGLSFSNTKGIVSNIDRKFLEIGNVIQIDASLNPGNSGGPVFKPGFELIGIAFASISNTQNLNFILPVSFMLDDLPKLGIETEITRTWLGFYFYEDNLLYQVKGTKNYQYFNSNNINNFENLEFLYSNFSNIKENDYYIKLQHFISILPEAFLVPFFYEKKIHFLSTERRPKYPIYYSILNDEINNCLSIFFDAKLTRESEYYKIEKLFNTEISLFYGIYQGDLVKIQNYYINSAKKMIIINLIIKRSKYGWVPLQIAISLSFSQPGFF